MTVDSDWQLGIDYGTTYTVAAVARGQTVTVIDVESNGRSRVPSAVFLNQDGRVLVGAAAQHQATFAPERFEPTPKRLFGEGELFLGDRLVAVTDLAAATIRRVYGEASRQQGETAPSVVRITHPAIWGDARLGVLREAVEKAGIKDYELLPEPVAAAARIGLLATSPGDTVAVYDFGGGTFDAAVLRRTDEGFEIAGRPAGRDPLGGEEIDQQLINYLAGVLGPGHEDEWENLLAPPDAGWRRRAMDLRSEVQRAKETLSEATVCQLWIPGLERDAQLTREELNTLIADDIGLTVDTLESALSDASVEVADLAGIYLVGGSSRIPLVADTILARTGLQPAVQENPKSIVAMGAAGWDILGAANRRGDTGGTALIVSVPEVEASAQPAPTAPIEEASASKPVPGAAADGLYVSRLLMAVGTDAWPGGSACVADLEVDRVAPPPLTLRARDEPARMRSTEEQALEAGRFRAERTPGYREHSVHAVQLAGRPGLERNFDMKSGPSTVQMLERYSTGNGRGLLMAGPEEARGIADSVTREDVNGPSSPWFRGPFSVMVPAGWTVTERLTLRRNGTNHVVQSTCTTLPGSIGEQAWRDRVLREAAANRQDAAFSSNVVGPVLNEYKGEIVTLTWVQNGTSMVTKVGLVVAGGYGYAVTISLPQSDQAAFASLARQARVTPSAPGRNP